MTKYRVGVFVRKGKRKFLCEAYTVTYNPDWAGCNVVEVEADSGKEAKKKAIASIQGRLHLDFPEVPQGVNVDD